VGQVTQKVFGSLPSGEVVTAVTLQNRDGLTVRLLSYGASIQSVMAPDIAGRFAEVTLGHPDLQSYVDFPQYAGATVGRVANRIAGAQFTLDGKVHKLAANHGRNSLHGGLRGIDKVNWKVGEVSEDGVTFTHTSPDGDEGYPGTLEVCAAYRLDDGNRLSVEYSATSDAPTLVNLSNHAYWNLAGAESGHSAMRHLLTIAADHYLPVDAELIPTGELRPVENTVFDFRTAAPIADRVRTASEPQLQAGRGFDHNWVLRANPSGQSRPVAALHDPWSGRTMTIDTDQPGLQFYSGNFFDGTVAGHGGRLARMGDFIALEPQAIPDTANQPAFGSIRLDPGGTYRNVIGWTFGCEERES
jgi:aldose 1-epimerase